MHSAFIDMNPTIAATLASQRECVAPWVSRPDAAALCDALRFYIGVAIVGGVCVTAHLVTLIAEAPAWVWSARAQGPRRVMRPYPVT